MKQPQPRSAGRNAIAILTIPIVMLFLIVITPFSLGIASPFDLCGMIDAGSRATSLSSGTSGANLSDRRPATRLHHPRLRLRTKHR